MYPGAVVSSKTILIVDDSADNRDVYSMFLEHFGYTVLTANDGWDGVQQARTHHPDLILMDISMPVLDGLEATELLKVDADTQAIPVIAITAHDDIALRSRAQEIGFESYLTKPTQPRRILQEVERCLCPDAGGRLRESSNGSVAPLNAPTARGDLRAG
jgi:two-component system, cell cycle response regulator DivK